MSGPRQLRDVSEMDNRRAGGAAKRQEQGGVPPNPVDGDPQVHYPDAVEVPVVVIARDIPAGTTGADAATNGMLREDTIQSTFRPATAITSLDQVADGVAVSDLPANQVVTLEHFGLPTDTTLAPAAPELCDR